MNKVALLLGLLPACGLKNRLLSMMPNWSVHRDARIAPCLISNVQEFRIAANATIGLGTIFRNLRVLDMARDSIVGPLNTVYGARELINHSESDDAGTFSLGVQAAVTTRHHLDCSGGLVIGKFSTVAGQSSLVMSHAVDIMESKQRARGVHIGDYCFVGAACTILDGVTICDRVVVGAASVIVQSIDRPQSLFAGSPAIFRKGLVGAKYFDRADGYIRPGS